MLLKYFLHESVCCFEKSLFRVIDDDDDDDEAVDVAADVFRSFSASDNDFTFTPDCWSTLFSVFG